MQKDYKRFEFSNQGFEDGLAWYITDHEILKGNGCAMESAEAMVTRLWDMYFEGRERSVIKFEDLLKAMMDFHKVWSEAERS